MINTYNKVTGYKTNLEISASLSIKLYCRDHKSSPICFSLKDHPKINLTKEGTDSYTENLIFIKKEVEESTGKEETSMSINW